MIIMIAIRTLISLLASLAVASTLIAATTMWRVLHDPVNLTTTLGSALAPVVIGVGHAIIEIARRL
jgi:hypothetical protein